VRIVERVRGGRNGHTAWVRAEVQWTPLVSLFLEHGYLLLDPPQETPTPPTSAERAAERMRRYRAKRRAECGDQPACVAAPLPEGLLSAAQAAAELGITVDALRGPLSARSSRRCDCRGSRAATSSRGE
jgi:hypothetical protein